MRLASTGGRPAIASALAGRACSIEQDRCVSRKELAAAGRDAMKALLLRPAERLILGELIGCWGETMVGERILVYPSNEYLVRRTGLSERSVRYGIRRLVERALVVPKDSANGKRFAIKSRAGELVDIFGFDLTPVFVHRGEWIELIAAQDAENEARSRLFDEVTICRRAIEETLGALARLSENCLQISDELAALVGRTPRRNLTVAKETLVPIVESWRSLRAVAEDIFYQAASGGKDCPHIKTRPPTLLGESLNKSRPEKAVGVELPSPVADQIPISLVVQACPVIENFVVVPKTEVDLVAVGRYLRASLGAHQSVWDEACQALGPVRAAAAVCLVLQLYEDDANSSAPRIRNAGGYLRSMVRLLAEGRVSLRSELQAMIRKRAAG